MSGPTHHGVQRPEYLGGEGTRPRTWLSIGEIVLRERLALIFEACWTKRGFFHPNVASWEYDRLLIWANREPLRLYADELAMLEELERLVLGPVR
jgi:hypothetical protein